MTLKAYNAPAGRELYWIKGEGILLMLLRFAGTSLLSRTRYQRNVPVSNIGTLNRTNDKRPDGLLSLQPVSVQGLSPGKWA